MSETQSDIVQQLTVQGTEECKRDWDQIVSRAPCFGTCRPTEPIPLKRLEELQEIIWAVESRNSQCGD